MSNELDYYAYLSEHTIQRLYAQTQRHWFVPGLGLELGLALPPFGTLKATTGEGRQAALTAQVKRVVAYLERHEPQHNGAVDGPKGYMKGKLPLFSYFLPPDIGAEH